MKKVLMIQILALIAMISFGQKVPIDLDKIQSIAKSDAYNILFDRYNANDTTLSLNDYVTIYYGHAFREDYEPNAIHKSEEALNIYLKNNTGPVDFKKVLVYTNLILYDHPFNIEQIFMTGVSYDKLEDNETSKPWFYKYDKLIRTILSSGDGLTEESAYIVTKVPDEYAILKALRLELTGQSLIYRENKKFDMISLSENSYGVENIYFDINLFFGK